MKRTSRLKRTPLKPVGKRGKRQAPEHAEARKALIERTEGLCEVCGKPGNAQHHVFRRLSHADVVMEAMGHVRVCQKHHDEFEDPITNYRWFLANRPKDAEALNVAAFLELALSKTRPVQDLRRAV